MSDMGSGLQSTQGQQSTSPHVFWKVSFVVSPIRQAHSLRRSRDELEELTQASFSSRDPTFISTCIAQVIKKVNCEEGPFHIANIWLPQMPANIASPFFSVKQGHCIPLGISSPPHPTLATQVFPLGPLCPSYLLH